MVLRAAQHHAGPHQAVSLIRRIVAFSVFYGIPRGLPSPPKIRKFWKREFGIFHQEIGNGPSKIDRQSGKMIARF
jgi:hypothetical protein